MPKTIYVTGVEGVKFAFEGQHRNYAKPDRIEPVIESPFYANAFAHGDLLLSTKEAYDAQCEKDEREAEAKRQAEAAEAAAKSGAAAAPAAESKTGKK